MTDSQFLRHLARAPVGRAVFGSAARAVQDLSLQCGTLCLNLSALMTSVESSQAFDLVTFQPKSDGIDTAAHLPGHGRCAAVSIPSDFGWNVTKSKAWLDS